MGFFDKVLKGLGFESEQKQPKEKKMKEEPKIENAAYTGVGATYDLAKLEEKKEPKTFVPKTQIEVQEVVDNLKTEDVLIADLSCLSQSDYMRGLDFISGAIYYTGGKIQRAGDKNFYLYPGKNN